MPILPKFFFMLLLAVTMGFVFAPEIAAQVRMMPLGNSITDGDGSSNEGGYRYYLYQALTNANISFNFVGSLRSGSGFPDTDHEGHGGFRADQLEVQTYLNNNPAEVVFLEIGTNDISTGDSATQVRDDIEALVDKIHNFNATIEIYLSTVVPRKDSNDLQTVTDNLNALLPDLVSTKFNAGYKIYLVDIASRFKADPNWKTNLMSGNLHPNDAGYDLMAQEWFTAYMANSGNPVTEFADNFNTGVLGAAWAAHPAFQVISEQLVNTSSIDDWSHFIAVPSVITNANVLAFTYGSLSDATARAFTGAALMLDAASTNANGYLIFHNFNTVKLYTIVNGVPGEMVQKADGHAPEPKAGDTFRVEWNTDGNGHHFCVYINGTNDACLTDPNKRQGNAAELYAGVMVNGNTNNGIDDFYTAKVIDSEPPAAVHNLEVISTTALSATLTWTAPGDDGNSGQARRYDLRYSTSPISNGSFNSATPVWGLPQPAPAGTRESVIVGGLRDGTSYYFALKTSDELGNTSELSNVATGSTVSLNIVTDGFNRAGPSLGSKWSAEPELQIVDSTVQNIAVADVWSPAIFREVRNPTMVSMKWGPKVTTYGTNWCGILVMANQTNTAQVDGYMVQRYDEGGKTRLWHISNGQFMSIIDEGNSLGPDPKAGAVMKVMISSDSNGHHFEVYINDIIDRVLTDPQKLEGNTSPLYAGFYLESTLGEANAIDNFSVGVLPAVPKLLVKESGDNQTRQVGLPLLQPLVVSLIDSFDNPLPGVPINFVVTTGNATVNNPPASDDNLRLEAEHAQLTPPMQTVEDPDASGGKYIVYPVGYTQDASATLNFFINTAGTYRIWTRSMKTGTQPGSWTISIDGGPDFVYDVFQGTTNSSWTWDLLSERGNGEPASPQFDPKLVNLAAGSHTIEFKARWEDTRLDKIILTADDSFVPNGKEEAGYITDANGIAAAGVTMGTKVGNVQIQATHGNLAPVTFNARAIAGPADSLVLAGGSGQSGPAGEPLPQPLATIVTDTYGNSVSGAPVSWLVTQGNGRLSKYNSVSDTNGIAITTLIPGNRGAVNKVKARAVYAAHDLEFEATTTSGIADSALVVSGAGQTGVVGTKLAAPLIIKVIDEAGHDIANYPVEVNLPGGGSTSIDNPVRNGDFEKANGSLPADWNPEGNPTATEVVLSNDALTGSKSLQVNSTRNAVGVSQSLKYESNASYTISFWAKVKRGTARVIWRLNDTSGNLVEETIDVTPAASDSAWQHYLVFALNGAAGTRNLLIRTAGSGEFWIDDVKILRNTGNDGQLAIAWTLGDTAGVQKMIVNDGALMENRGSLRGLPMTVLANAKAGAPKTFVEFSGNGQVGSAGQPLPKPFVVKVADIIGNGVEKINVTFTVTAGGGRINGQGTSVVVPTDSTGLAKALLTMGPTPGVTNTVVATAPSVSGANITFNAIAAIPNKLEYVTGVAQGSAGHPVSTPLTVRVTDNSGNRISGFPVIFKVEEGGGYIGGQTTATIPTDSVGEAKAFPVLGLKPGAQNKVVASALYNNQPLQGSPITFVVVAAKLKDFVLVSGNDQTGIAGELLPKPLKTKIRDELGKGIKEQSVIYTIISGNGRLGGNVTTKTVLTDSFGVAQVSWTLGTKPGVNNNQVRAETNPVLAGSPLVFTASALVGPPAVLKKVSGDSLSGIANNPLPAPFVTRVTDKVGNGLPSIPVIFTIKSGGGHFNSGRTQDTVRTDSNGRAQITLTVGSTVGRYNNVVEARAFNGSLELTNSPIIFVASSTASTARTMVLQSGNRQTGRAGLPLANPLVVQIFDRNNLPVFTHPVRFQVVRGGGVFANGKTDTTVSTDDNGLAILSLTLGGAVRPDSQIVRATSNDGVHELQNSPVIFVAYATAGLPSSATSYVQANSPVPADGTTPCVVKVFIRDRFNNPVSGVSVQIEVSGETINQSILTDAAGQAVFSFASTHAGRKTIYAKINDEPIGRSVTVLFTPLAAQSINLNGGHAQTGNVNTVLAQPLSVRIEDKFNNGIPDYPVEFIVEAGDGRLLRQSPVLTDSNGVANMSYILGAAPGENRVRAVASDLANSPIIFVATALNSAPINLEYVAGNNQQGIAGQILSNPLVVKVTDENKRIVYGVPVHFTVTFGGGMIDGSTSAIMQTDEFGQARVEWQLGPAAGINTLRAAASGLNGSPIDFQAIAASGRAMNLVLFSGDGASGPVNQELPTPLIARVTDVNGNGVDGAHVFFELIQGSGTLSGGTGSSAARDVVTSGGGFASVRVAFGPEVGARKIRVTSIGLTGSPAQFTVYGRSGAPKTMEVIARTNHQRGTAGKPLNFPLQVVVYDNERNPVEGVQVNFVVTQNTGHFSGLLNTFVLTNHKGIAEVKWTISAGINQAQAVAIGLQVPAILFEATGVTDNNFPILADLPDQQKREGERIEFVVQATDEDNDPIRYGAKNLPLGAVFDSLGTRIFTWQINGNSADHYEVSFLAYDTRGGVDEEVVFIDIQNRNQPPRITSRFPVGNRPGQPDTTLPQPGTLLLMRVNAIDPDGDALSYRWYVNGVFAGSIFSTFEFRGELEWNIVQAVVFDLEDTVRTVWGIKVPVELTSFTAHVGDGPGVKLTWKTGSETNNAGFNVLRSRNWSGHYAKLNDQLIPATPEGNYRFVDATAEAGARYYYKLEALDHRGNITVHGPIVVDVTPPATFDLSQNYPNPFNPATHIRYQLPQAVHVRLSIYNLLGQEIRKLVDGRQPTGYHTIVWDGRDHSGQPLPTGVYYYRLQAGNFTATKKMLLAK